MYVAFILRISCLFFYRTKWESNKNNLQHFFEGLYSQKIKTLKNFKIKNKENKISDGRGNSLRFDSVHSF